MVRFIEDVVGAHADTYKDAFKPRYKKDRKLHNMMGEKLPRECPVKIMDVKERIQKLSAVLKMQDSGS